MEVCLIRHAIAEERGPRWPDDSLRPLTLEGKAKMAPAARGIATLFQPEVILTSPYTRARETAEIVAAATGAPVEVSAALASGDEAALFAAAAATGRARVACVGHEPWLSEALSWALTGDASVASVFRKGAAAKVEFGVVGPGAGTLEWLIQPAALRALSG